MAGGSTSHTNSGMGAGTRALDAAVSSTTPFRPHTGEMALGASERHFERWAPERYASRRSRSMSALSFADRVLSPYIEPAQRAGSSRLFGDSSATSGRERNVEATSWVFPRPWYQDELEWMASARAASAPAEEETVWAWEQPESQRRPEEPAGATRTASPATTPARMPLEWVAPSMAPRPTLRAATARSHASQHLSQPMIPAAPGVRSALRAWTPLATGAAAQAAELMASLVSTRADDTSARTVSPSRVVLESLAPRDVAVSESGQAATLPAEVRSRVARALAAEEAPRQHGAGPERQESLIAAAERPAGAAPEPESIAPARGESVMHRTPAQASATPGMEASAVTSGRTATASTGDPRTAQAPATSVSASVRAIDLLTRMAATGTIAMAPAAAPRIAMPAGLGGLISGVRAAHMVARPLLARASAQVPGSLAAPSPAAARQVQLAASAREAQSVRSVQSDAAAGGRISVDGTVAHAPADSNTGPAIAVGPANPGTLGAESLESRAAGTPSAESFEQGAERRASREEAALREPAPTGSAPIAPAASGGNDPGGRISGGTVMAPAAAIQTRPASAYQAVQQSRPAGLEHLAWSDRWLARFAGASTAALAALDTTMAGKRSVVAPQQRLRTAPLPVFVSAVSEPEVASRQQGMDSGAGMTAALPQQQLASSWQEEPSPSPVMRHARLEPSTAPAVPSSVEPMEPQPRQARTSQGAALASAGPSEPAAAPAMPSAPRINDGEAVPDEVFAAIAAARAGVAAPLDRGSQAIRSPATQSIEEAARLREIQRRSPVRPAAAQPVAGVAAPPAAAIHAAQDGTHPVPSAPEQRASSSGERAAFRARASKPAMDRVLDAGPAVPGPGIRPMLAASPAARVLGTLLPLPAVPSFDVRAVHGSELAQAYMSGLVEPATQAARVQAARAAEVQSAGEAERRAVATSGGHASTSASPVLAALAARAPVAEVISSDVSSVSVISPVSASSDPAVTAQPRQSGSPRAEIGTMPAEPQPAPYTQRAESTRSVVIPRPLLARGEDMSAQTSISPASTFAAAAPTIASYGPGQAATRAEAWSAAREQTAADLAFDFVPPELMLAASTYRFGPAEAAQAARLSAAGSRALVSLASAVDFAFLDRVVHAREGAASAPISATPFPAPEDATVRDPYLAPSGKIPARAASPERAHIAAQQPGSRAVQAAAAQAATAAQQAGSAAQQAAAAAQIASIERESQAVIGSAQVPDQVGAPARTPPARRDLLAPLGGPVRAPKGAFLMPRAAATALNVQAGNADAVQPRSLAALDLLAARAVARASIFVAPGGAPAPTMTSATAAAVHAASTTSMSAEHTSPEGTRTEREEPRLLDAGSGDRARPEAAPEMQSAGAQPRLRSQIIQDTPAAAAAALGVTGALPSGFEALYAELAQSPAGRSISPAVRAARALALAGTRGSGQVTRAQARNAAALAVMPLVVSGDAARMAATDDSTWQQSAASGVQAADLMPEQRVMAARAGESLRSFVAPAGASAGEQRSMRMSGDEVHAAVATRQAAAAAEHSPPGAVLRAPTAAQPLVVSGGSSPPPAASAPRVSHEPAPRASQAPAEQMIRAAEAKRAAGNAEGIPSWFAEAARRLFADSPMGDGITLAEMTLVTSAPARQVAASRRDASGSTQAPDISAGGESQASQPAPDVEELAEKVYAEVCRLIDTAKQRNGDPWL